MRDSDGTLIACCRNCHMTSRDDFYSVGKKVYAVLQWADPSGRVLAIRPVVSHYAPKTAPPLDGAFPNVPVTGMPECPKSPHAWAT